MDDVNDDILGHILERIDSQPSLIRAAATCKRWRRAIAHAGFLRRYRSLHGPTIAGHYFDEYLLSVSGGERPLFVPSPSWIDARHFSLDFLPRKEENPICRQVLDSRGSLLLVDLSGHFRFGGIPDLAVCEPLTRQHVRIPAPGFENDGGRFSWGFYLIAGDAAVHDAAGVRSSISMSNFRVMCVFHRGGVAHAGVFTAGGTGEFSSSVLPPAAQPDTGNFTVTDGRDGRPHFVIVANGVIKVLSMLDDDWVLEKEVVVSEVTRGLPCYVASLFSDPVDIVMRGVGFVILSRRVNTYVDAFVEFFSPIKWWTFSMDIETMEVAPADDGLGPMAYPCELPWPPALQACLDKECTTDDIC